MRGTPHSGGPRVNNYHLHSECPWAIVLGHLTIQADSILNLHSDTTVADFFLSGLHLVVKPCSFMYT